MWTQHRTAASTHPFVGNSPFPSSVLPPLCSLVFTCYLCFPLNLGLSRLADEKAPSHLPCAQTPVPEGALPAKPRLSLTLLTNPKASIFSEAVFMTADELDTDCLICIGARHRDAQNLAGMPRHKAGACCKKEEAGPMFVLLWGLLLAGQKGFPGTRKLQIKALKGLLIPFFSLPALHQHSLMLSFKQKLPLWSNYYVCGGADSMRRLQEVLANQLSLRHHGWTLSGLAVMATHGTCPISSSSLPQPLHQWWPKQGLAASIRTGPGPGSAAKQLLPTSTLVSKLLGQTALGEGYSRHGGGKALRTAAVQSNRAHLSEPLTRVHSQDGGFCYKLSSFSSMLFSRVCL